MNITDTVKRKNNKFIIAAYIFFCFLLFTCGFILLKFPQKAGEGITKGINICLGTLIPSLFPFMLLSSVAVNSDIMRLFEVPFSSVMSFCLRLPGKALAVILLSVTGGYPLGGKTVKSLLEKGELTRSQGRRLMLFCVNPGPAFCISTLGHYMLGNKTAGSVIYLSVLTSSLIIAIISGFLSDGDDTYFIKSEKDDSPPLSEALVRSVSQAGRDILNVCGWVIVFSCVISLIEILPLPQGLKTMGSYFLEITNGCTYASQSLSLPLIAGLVGFGGFCTHFQIMPTLISVRLKYKYFITSRIIGASLSTVICHMIIRFFPVSCQVFSFGAIDDFAFTRGSHSLSYAMLIMCALVLAGDALVIKIKKRGADAPLKINKN